MKELSFEELLDTCLSTIPSNIDKREGSLIYTALAPICAELSKFYLELKSTYSLSFVDSAFGEYLDKVVAQFGLMRKKSTPSQRIASFYTRENQLLSIPLGYKFSIGTLIYEVTEALENGTFLLLCLTHGSEGNKLFGTLSPCQYVQHLELALLQDILVPGEDQESDERLKERFYIKVNAPSFGGNISDYKTFLLSMEGVTGVRIYPCYAGGGTVKISLTSTDFAEPISRFISSIQDQVDPLTNTGEGLGFAPIGHKVFVTGAKNFTVDFQSEIIYKDGWNFEKVKSSIEKELDEYLLEVRKQFTKEPILVVRISQIESRFLSLPGILDIGNSKLNGESKNLHLKEDDIPVRGVITC